jgi:hypothetical protein
MKVGVIHRISDPETAQSSGQALFEPHEGVRLLQFCPSQDFSAAPASGKQSPSTPSVSSWTRRWVTRASRPTSQSPTNRRSACPRGRPLAPRPRTGGGIPG